MANDIFSVVLPQLETLYGYKNVIPTDTTAYFSVDSEDEAHYLCSILNFKIVRDFIKSFSSAGRGFGAPSVMEHVGIPKFDPENKLHQSLAQSSKTLHNLKAKNQMERIEELEKANDELVKKLFGIK